MWKSAGRPRSGELNNIRIRCKFKYKSAIKEVAASAEMAFNDKLYNHLCRKDNDSFWRTWHKKFCMNSMKPTGVINRKTGDDNIRKEFTEYYKAVYQPNTPAPDNWYKVELDELLDSYTRSDTNTVTPSVDMHIMQS